ncbi:hypothetical protein ACVIW2_008102 [Bradyrhizobium huanghuaihaiense]
MRMPLILALPSSVYRHLPSQTAAPKAKATATPKARAAKPHKQPAAPMGCKLVGTVKGTKLWAGDCVTPSEAQGQYTGRRTRRAGNTSRSA